MEFPKHVIEVKEELEASNDERLKMMKLLTEQKDKDDYNEVGLYEKIWTSIFKEESKYNGVSSKDWVYSFLDAVIEASKLPKHAYLSAIERKELIKDIAKHTKFLKKNYKKYGFNVPLISNDGQFFHGFPSYELVEDNGYKRIVKTEFSRASVNDALEYFAERAIEEINEYSYKGKQSKNVKATRFIRRLAERNKERYNVNLNTTLKNSAFAVYQIVYEDSDISNLLNTRS